MKSLFLKRNESIQAALIKLNKNGKQILLIVNDENKLEGTLTDGDIRRALLAGANFDSAVENFFNQTPTYFIENSFSEKELNQCIMKNIKTVPILSKDQTVQRIIHPYEAISTPQEYIQKKQITSPVIIMAGGKGTRMEPFTHILPKPLMPIKDKTMSEIIINQFRHYGVSNFYFTLNHKAEMIKAYFNGINKDYSCHYIDEPDFLGTGGSLRLLPLKELENDFFVTNCDILVQTDYSEVLEYHQKSGAALTVLTAFQGYKIPYGVVRCTNGDNITKIDEKPELSMPINTGVYLLNKQCLEHIPKNKIYNMTDLIHDLIQNKKVVKSFLIGEKDYIDIGQWEEFHRAKKLFEG